MAIAVLCEQFVLDREIIRHDKLEFVNSIKNKIDLIYAQIKKNEENKTGYLFMGVKSSNLEHTIAKLEAMNTFGETFVPRIE